MAAPGVEYTPVVSPRGTRVHALALLAPGGHVVCGARRPRGGWRIALRRLGCPMCKAKIYPGAKKAPGTALVSRLGRVISRI